MPIEYIWAVSEDGVPFRIPSPSDPKCTSEIDWQEVPCSDGSAICTIVASPSSAFAIDRSGRVLILVLPTHISIRKRVEIYNNQRWIGIWKGTFFIDRPRYSDESGRITKDPTKNEISVGWSWEDKWAPQLDPRKYDKEGWQYSLSFLAPKWEKQCRMFHIVRRRLLKRNMRYTSHDKWIEMPNENSRMFTELAVGGSDVMGEGQSLLFGLGSDGNIYRRTGIQSDNPGGDDWELIPKILIQETDDVTLISVSPTLATLVAITWDGKMFCRKGITRKNPTGLAWESLPTPNNKAVICAAIGSRTLWCITADGSVWFTRIEVDEKMKEHVTKSISANKYLMVTQGGVSKLSVSKNDEVFCVSTQGKIEVRTGIDVNEPSGKRFEKIVDRGDPKDQKWISISSATVSFVRIPDYFLSSSSLQSRIEVLQFKKADWRLKILERLEISTQQSWSVMNCVTGIDLESPEDQDVGNGNNCTKQFRCQVMTGEIFRSVNITINDKTLDLSAEQVPSKSIKTSLIRSVLPSFQRLPQKYLLYIFTGSQSEFECFAFTDESTRSAFQSSIENIIREHIYSSTRSTFSECIWSVSTEGVVRWHCLAELSKESNFEKLVNPGDSRGLVVEGIFESIECGAKGSVWAVDESGSLYALNSHFAPLNSHNDAANDFKISIQKTLKMYEYQKHAIFRGFVSFQGSQKGISGFMCDGKPCPSSFSSLPSSSWSWIDSTWQLESDDWKYSNDINGPFELNEKGNGKVRRRCWTRQARFDSKKSPWCHVEAPPIRSIRLAKQDSSREAIPVVVLTQDGHILKRNGVDRENFSGTSWTEILTDSIVSSIHLQWEGMKLWCFTTDGMILSRPINVSDTGSFLTSSDWRHLEIDITLISKFLSKAANGYPELTGVCDILYVRIGFILFRIDTKNGTVSDAYPMDNLQQATVNAKGSICLRGTNITIVRDWRVVPYTDRKATIIAMRNVERAINMGNGLKNVSFF
ncbi:unnamed protein product [Caenorhabditis brenneri]